ncbi:hypothetical protein [Streptomyces sp. NPDC051636]|uniref:hypothetical protein n=1 Tax=Streptomyces sp. NPDC051636 TaxID=3365663 RepID=UPI00379B2B07
MVNFDLDQLKVGENWVVVGRKDGYDIHGRNIAPGDGWCRAMYAPECAWPRGADLCVLVEWHPCLKAGSNWAVRLEAVTTALRSLDYVVEHAGRPVDPTLDLRANLLVYRMEPGKAPPQRPQDAWTHVPPRRTAPYSWHETSPQDQVSKVLRDTKAARNGSRLVVWDIESALWPPRASSCTLVRWWPTPGAPSRAIHEGLREFTSAARDAGYCTRLQECPIPDAIEDVDLLVYREADSTSPA